MKSVERCWNVCVFDSCKARSRCLWRLGPKTFVWLWSESFRWRIIVSADYASVGAVNVDVKSIFGPAGLSILDITMRGLGLITSAPMTVSSTFAVIAAMLPACIFFVPLQRPLRRPS